MLTGLWLDRDGARHVGRVRPGLGSRPAVCLTLAKSFYLLGFYFFIKQKSGAGGNVAAVTGKPTRCSGLT